MLLCIPKCRADQWLARAKLHIISETKAISRRKFVNLQFNKEENDKGRTASKQYSVNSNVIV